MKYFFILTTLTCFITFEGVAMPQMATPEKAVTLKKIKSSSHSSAAPKCSTLYENCNSLCSKEFKITKDSDEKPLELCKSACVKGLASCGGESKDSSEIFHWQFEKGCQQGCDIASSSAELKGKENFKQKCKKICGTEVNK